VRINPIGKVAEFGPIRRNMALPCNCSSPGDTKAAGGFLRFTAVSFAPKEGLTASSDRMMWQLKLTTDRSKEPAEG